MLVVWRWELGVLGGEDKIGAHCTHAHKQRDAASTMGTRKFKIRFQIKPEMIIWAGRRSRSTEA